MPHYHLKFVRDLGFLKKYRSETEIEAPDAAEAVRVFLAGYRLTEIDSRSVDKFTQSRWRILKARTPDGGNVWIVSVKEVDTVRCDICSGDGTYPYRATGDLCFACAGSGRITPQLSARLNQEFSAELERRGADALGGEEYKRLVMEVLDQMQYGR